MTSASEILFVIVTAIVVAFSSINRPTRARCPKGRFLAEGVRRSGEFACFPQSIGGDDDVKTGRETAYQPPGRLGGHIYCPNGFEPIVQDGVSVRCRRGEPRW